MAAASPPGSPVGPGAPPDYVRTNRVTGGRYIDSAVFARSDEFARQLATLLAWMERRP